MTPESPGLPRESAAREVRPVLGEAEPKRAGQPGPGVTFSQLQQESDDLAMALVDLGVVIDERIGIVGENSPR